MLSIQDIDQREDFYSQYAYHANQMVGTPTKTENGLHWMKERDEKGHKAMYNIVN